MLGFRATKLLTSRYSTCYGLSNVYKQRPQARLSSSSSPKSPQKNQDTEDPQTLSHDERSLSLLPKAKALAVNGALDLPPVPGQRKPKLDNIIPSDLRATILAHRDANREIGRAWPIRKIPTDVPDDLIFNKILKFENHAELDAPKTILTHGIALEESETRPGENELSPEKNQRESDLTEHQPLTKKTVKRAKLKTGFPLPGRILNRLDVNIDGNERLNQEILAFEAWSSPTRSEREAVDDCKERLLTFVAQIDPSWSFEIHGSRATGLANPLSDLDYIIHSPDSTKNPIEGGSNKKRRSVKRAALNVLFKLKKAFDESSDYHQATVCIPPKIPTLTATDKRTGLRLQAIASPAVTTHTTEFVKYYLAEYPQLKPLYVLIRRCLERKGLSSAAECGLSSYPLVVAILTALTHAQENFSPDDLGRQLLHVLDFWANADCVSLGYAADPPLTFPKYSSSLIGSQSFEDHELLSEREDLLESNKELASDDRPPSINETTELNSLSRAHPIPFQDPTYLIDSSDPDPYLASISVLAARNNKLRAQSGQADISKTRLSLQDPANPTNDVGRSCVRMDEIQQLFRSTHATITGEMRKWDKASPHDRHFGTNGAKYLIGSMMYNRDWASVAAKRERLQMAAPGYM